MTNESLEQKEIHACTEQWAEAMRTGQINDIMKHYSEDIVAYDAMAQLQFVGKDAYKAHWLVCLSYAPDGMIFKTRDMVIHSDGTLAFSYSLANCGCYDENGNDRSSWMRVTRGLRKINGKWLAVHEHFSAPIDMESGKALFDLQP